MISDYIPMSPLVTGQGSDSPKVMFTRALLGRVESDAAYGSDNTDGWGGGILDRGRMWKWN